MQVIPYINQGAGAHSCDSARAMGACFRAARDNSNSGTPSQNGRSAMQQHSDKSIGQIQDTGGGPRRRATSPGNNFSHQLH